MAFNMKPPVGTLQSTQVKYPFNGHLNPNEVFGSIYNMIISQDVRYPELADNYGFVEKFRVDGSLFGDTKLFYAQDVLSSRPWSGDGEASNLLATERPDDPKCQAIVLDQFRIIKTTLDSYLTKRAWATEGAFSTFNGIVQAMVKETKKLYEVTLVNSYLGTVEGGATRSLVEVPLSDITETGEAKNRLEAQTIAQYLADLMVDMKDYSRDFNDYGFMRAYTEDQLMVIWNSKFVNKINKLDLPTIFNKSGLMDKFEQNILPARYFGDINTTGSTTASLNTSVRALVEGDFGGKHCFPGDLLPGGAEYGANETYTVDEDIICKVITKDTIKYMAAFEVATEFWNPQALLTNHMLIWGFSSPDRLLDQPCVTLHAD